MSYYKELKDINIKKVRKVGDFDFTLDDDGCYLIAYHGNDKKVSLPEDTYLSPYFVIPGALNNSSIEEIYIPDNALVCAESLNLEVLKKIYTVKGIDFIKDETKEKFNKLRTTGELEVIIVREKKNFVLEIVLQCKKSNNFSSIFIRNNFNVSYHRATNIRKFLIKKGIFEEVTVCNKSVEEISSIILDESYKMPI